MEGFVDPLLGHHDDGDDVDDDADDGDDEARRTVDPKLQPEVFFTFFKLCLERFGQPLQLSSTATAT